MGKTRLEKYRQRLEQEHHDAQALLSRTAEAIRRAEGASPEDAAEKAVNSLTPRSFSPIKATPSVFIFSLSGRRWNAFPRKTSACASRAARLLTVSVWMRYPGRGTVVAVKRQRNKTKSVTTKNQSRASEVSLLE